MGKSMSIMILIEYDMPDKYLLKYNEEGIIDILAKRLSTDIESTVFAIVQALTKLATKSISP